MRARWIFNSNAGSAKTFEVLRPLIEAIGGQELCASEDSDDTARAIVCSVADGFDTVIACGGDGTVNRVVSGLMHCDGDRPRLGVLPIGTGNDFARTLAMPLDGEVAVAALVAAADAGQVRPCDVARVRAGTQSRWMVNVSAGGFSGQVNEAATDDVKNFWGPLAYARSAITAISELKPYRATLMFDTTPPEEIELVNVIVANARSAAGGTIVAPHASVEDGLLDVVLVRGGNLIDYAAIAARLVAGDYTRHDLVERRRCRTVRIRSEPPMVFNVDGDPLDPGPIDFELLPGALRVLVGVDYAPSVPEPNEDS